MKYLKINILLALFTFLAVSPAVKAQDKDEATVTAMLEAKNYIFKAQTALPMTGRMIHLTSDYDVIIRPDSVISFLPYYGRAYSAPVNSTDGGIKFTSTNFGYQAAHAKKKSWDITIKPKDVSDVQDMTLTVFTNGSATLRVNNQNKQAISFQGYVTKGKPLDKRAF